MNTFLLLLSTSTPTDLFAQTPGLIYTRATSGGNLILDPNGDGYVSPTAAGWTAGARDEGAGFSEIPYRAFPALLTEPLNDLTTGSGGGHTDLAPPNTNGSTTGSPLAAYFNGRHLLFRFRVGSASTASKGYSVLIDTDGNFKTQSTDLNPGFEFEVVLANNFDVSIYDHREKVSGGSKIWSGSVAQFSQKAVAASQGSGNPDYFYDFYVPLSAFPTGTITATTPLRMSGITVTSAQSGITGTVSDIGGINYAAYNFNRQRAWGDIISSFPATSPSELQSGEFEQLQAVAPVVGGPINANSTTISGTSVEAAGSVITVFRNGTAICGGAGQPGCPTVSSTGIWTLSGISSTLLASGNTITATVTPANKTVSPISNAVTVSTGLCTATPAPTLSGITGTTGLRSLVITPSFSGNQIITVHNLTSGQTAVTGVLNLTAGTQFPASSTGAPTALNVSQNSNYRITVTPTTPQGVATGCTSLLSNQICYTTGGNFNNNLQTVSISSVAYNNVSNTANATGVTPVPTNLASVTVNIRFATSAPPSGNVILNRNGVAIATAPYTGGTTTQTITIPIPSLSTPLAVGDLLNVRTVQTATCAGESTPSNFLIVSETTTAPTINPLDCGLVTTLTGTSTEQAGTVLQFYTGGTAGQRNGTLVIQSGTSNPITAIVTTQGNWSVSFTAASGGGIAAGTLITARAQATGKVRSINSNVVSSTPAPTAPTITQPIAEGSTTIDGTGAAPGSQVTLIIDGTPFTPVTATQTGAFTVTGLSAFEVFAGASVSATYTSDPSSTCVSDRAAPVIVTCVTPSTAPTITPTTFTTCSGGVVSATINNTEPGISYALTTRTGTSPEFIYTATGSSVLGTGGSITLTSGALTSNTTLYVRARRFTGTNCDAILPTTIAVTVNAAPVISGLSFSPTSMTLSCPGAATVQVAGTLAANNYQLVNTSGQLVGTAVEGTGTSTPIGLSTGVVSTNNSAFTLRVTNIATGCTATPAVAATTFTVNLTGSPTLTNTVTTAPTICANTAPNITVDSPQAGFTYQLFDATTNASVGTGVPVTSPAPTSQNLTTTNPLPAGTYAYYVGVKPTTGECANSYRLNTPVNISVIAGPTATAASSWSAAQCGNNLSVALTGNSPATGGSGVWSVSSTTGNPAPTITSPTSPTTTATGLNSGSYTFTWTVTSGCGGGTAANNVTVIVNCPAEYLLAAPRYQSQYNTGTVLASAFDPDGGIQSASLVLGNSLPPGTSLSPTTGNITVSDPASLIPGTYTFRVITTDQNGITTTSPLTLTFYGEAPTTTSLPVELVYFTATKTNNQVLLQWLTASETDNDRFEIERSTDAKTYEKIGTVAGKGNTSQKSKYNFTDAAPLAGTAYYRLKQVDFDGAFAYSSVIAVDANVMVNNMQLQAHPNPFSNQVTVTVTAPQPESATVRLIDMQGRVLLVKQVELSKGLNELELNLNKLAFGMYLLKVSGNGIEASTRIMKSN